MAFVDHDEIEEVGRELLVGVLFFLSASHSLVEAKVDLVRFIYLSILRDTAGQCDF